jgi:hypothetical protein
MSRKRNPKQSIEAVQFGAALLPLEHYGLLAKSSGLQSKFVARHGEGPKVGAYAGGTPGSKIIALMLGLVEDSVVRSDIRSNTHAPDQTASWLRLLQ